MYQIIRPVWTVTTIAADKSSMAHYGHCVKVGVEVSRFGDFLDLSTELSTELSTKVIHRVGVLFYFCYVERKKEWKSEEN